MVGGRSAPRKFGCSQYIQLLAAFLEGRKRLVQLFPGEAGVHHGPDPGSYIPVPVTVVIPFRNELERLPELVGDLMHQSFPTDHLEIIFVNDHSTNQGRNSKI